MIVDLVFAPDPVPKPALTDWAHRSADEDLARIIDDTASGDGDH